SQALAESLQAQQEALTETNKRLEQQTRSLQKSEELLKKQQDELQKTNLELEEKAHLLAGQKAEVEQKNKEVEQAKVALEEKAEQLALISKYKSEFLANMSHELRTPLNSLLILSQMLSENAEGNLTTKQVGFAQTIHGSGSDLLDLINDLLDLSKIESGTMAVDITPVPFGEVRKFVESTFRQVADLKGLQFQVDLDQNLPPALQTDTKRLQQVLKNLLSNAFKFTEKGTVTLRASIATGGWNPEQEMLNAANAVVAFSVSDTGIGIPKEKHGVIFEAFQQGDTGTSRKFGGTGLGLSISRQITRLLGGEIRIESAPGEGSTFTLYLPLIYPVQPIATPASDGDGTAVEPATPEPKLVQTASSRVMLAPVVERAVADDRSVIEDGDRILLIAEDDPNFAQILLDLARDRGFKGLVAHRADRALALAREYQPTAVTLDLRFPDADGWTILDRLKHD
ncbi:MAG: ATP-binding protein, partial [Actinomycetota bacterium]